MGNALSMAYADDHQHMSWAFETLASDEANRLKIVKTPGAVASLVRILSGRSDVAKASAARALRGISGDAASCAFLTDPELIPQLLGNLTSPSSREACFDVLVHLCLCESSNYNKAVIVLSGGIASLVTIVTAQTTTLDCRDKAIFILCSLASDRRYRSRVLAAGLLGRLTRVLDSYFRNAIRVELSALVETSVGGLALLAITRNLSRQAQ